MSDSSSPGGTRSSTSGPGAAAAETRAVGHYEITAEIGRGGAAVVYLARQVDLDRLVALKELRVSSSRPEDFARRFLRESRVAGSLSHPNIVTVYEYFEHDGVPYIVMEYLERGSLRPYVGKLGPAALAGVLEGVLAGLTCGEQAGIVHRDLKPENIMVTGDGRVKLTDFGIAKATQKVGVDQYETTVGMTVGTPSYMAPEQALGEPVGPWTDLYSVGIMAWEHLVGHVPFGDKANTPTAVLLRHVNEQIPAPITERPDMDPALSDWVTRLVANNSADRPQSAAEAWDALEQIVVAHIGPLWRREARLNEDVSRRPQPVQTREPADRFGAYPVIEKPVTDVAEPVTNAGDQARESPDAAAGHDDGYHTYLGEDAPTPARSEPPAAVAPPAPLVVRNLVLRPEAVRLRPGERAEIKVTLEGGPAAEAKWELAGGASAFATVSPTSDGARIEIRPGRGEPPWSSSLEVRCLGSGAPMAVASVPVEILAEEVTPATAPAPAPAAASAPSAPAGAAPPTFLARLVGIVASLAYIGCLFVPAYVKDDNEKLVSFWTATHGDKDNTPIHFSQLRILVLLTFVVLVMMVISAFAARRAGGVVALIASAALLAYSLTVPSTGHGYGFHHYGPTYFVSLAMCGVMAAASAYIAFAPSVRRSPP